MTTRCHWSAGSLLALLILLTTGCTYGPEKGTVGGTVTYRLQPVTAGTVYFTLPEKGVGAEAKIDETGRYTLTTPIEVGTYTVTVQPPVPEPGVPLAKSALSIPKKYADPATSKLTVTIQSGTADYPLELTD